MNIISFENMALGEKPEIEDDTVFMHTNFLSENKKTKAFKHNSGLVLIECDIGNTIFPDDTQVYCGQNFDADIETEEVEVDVPEDEIVKVKKWASKKIRPIRFVGNKMYSKTIKARTNSVRQTKIYPSIPTERWNDIMLSIPKGTMSTKYAAHIKKARANG